MLSRENKEQYRNPPAHTRYLYIEKAQQCRNCVNERKTVQLTDAGVISVSCVQVSRMISVSCVQVSRVISVSCVQVSRMISVSCVQVSRVISVSCIQVLRQLQS